MEVTSLSPLVDMVLKVTTGNHRDMEDQATDLNLKVMEEDQATDRRLLLKDMEEEATRLNLKDMEEEDQVTVVDQVTMVHQQATDLHMEETSKQVDTVVDQVTMVPQEVTAPIKIMAEAPTVALQATRIKDTARVKVKDMEEEAIIQDTEVGTVGQKKRK